jgi:alkylation response protein AidB-like acyl-CoA dehydrogenase
VSTSTVHASAEEARAVAEAARETEWNLPSFAKELYLGRLRLDLIHPHPRPDEERRERSEKFLADLREFCTNQMDGEVIEQEHRIPTEYVKGLAELGCFGMKIPTQYGGLGLSQVTYNRALMLIASVHPALGALMSAHQSIGVPEPIKMFGTDAQKAEYLPRCARGAISAFLLTEPDVGSDPARVGTTAVPTEDGEAYLINGVKLWSTNGTVAEIALVMARVPKSEGHRGGISAFVVEQNAPGITIERRNRFMGLHGIENGVSRFHDVRVSKDALVGREGAGLKIALTTLNAGRLAIPAMCASASAWSLKIAREWASERVQWGRPVGQHGAITNKIAFIAATTFALEAVVDMTAHMADQGRNDIRIEAALAKLWASEISCVVSDELIQIRGGRGYETAASLKARGERAVPAEQLDRDLRINRIFEGSSEIMRLLIARDAVDEHLKAAGDIIDPKVDAKGKAVAGMRAAGFYAKWLPQLAAGKGQIPTSYAEFGDLAEHLRFVERTSRKLARSTFYGMARWQAKLEYQQGFLGRIVDVGAELFAMTASISRAEMIRVDEGAERGKAAYELADLFCQQSRLRVDHLLDALWSNTDAPDKKMAKGVMAGQYAWLEECMIDKSEGTGPWIADSSHGPSKVENVYCPFQ